MLTLALVDMIATMAQIDAVGVAVATLASCNSYVRITRRVS